MPIYAAVLNMACSCHPEYSTFLVKAVNPLVGAKMLEQETGKVVSKLDLWTIDELMVDDEENPVSIKKIS